MKAKKLRSFATITLLSFTATLAPPQLHEAQALCIREIIAQVAVRIYPAKVIEPIQIVFKFALPALNRTFEYLHRSFRSEQLGYPGILHFKNKLLVRQRAYENDLKLIKQPNFDIAQLQTSVTSKDLPG